MSKNRITYLSGTLPRVQSFPSAGGCGDRHAPFLVNIIQTAMKYYQFYLIVSTIWTAQANPGDKRFARLMAILWLLLSFVAWILDK